MAKLEIQIGDKIHRVVYIDYINGIPHQVMTTNFISTSENPYWRLYNWDFFANNGNKNDVRAYNSGSGGTPKEIPAPQYVDGYIGKYWISDDAEFKGKPENAKRLKNPIPVADCLGQRSTNPFKIAEITDSYEYCDRCGHESSDFCYEHKYDDIHGNARYIDDNSCAE